VAGLGRNSRTEVIVVGDDSFFKTLEGRLETKNPPNRERILLAQETNLDAIRGLSMADGGDGAYNVGIVIVDMREGWEDRLYNYSLQNSKIKIPLESVDQKTKDKKVKFYLESLYFDVVRHSGSPIQLMAVVNEEIASHDDTFKRRKRKTMDNIIAGMMENELIYRQELGETSSTKYKTICQINPVIIGGTGKAGRATAIAYLRNFDNVGTVTILGRNEDSVTRTIEHIVVALEDDIPDIRDKLVGSTNPKDVHKSNVAIVYASENIDLENIEPKTTREVESFLHFGTILEIGRILADYKGPIVVGTNSVSSSCNTIYKLNNDPKAYERIFGVYPEVRRFSRSIENIVGDIIKSMGKFRKLGNGKYVQVINPLVLLPHSNLAVPVYNQAVLHFETEDGRTIEVGFGDKIDDFPGLEEKILESRGNITESMRIQGYKEAVGLKDNNYAAGKEVAVLLSQLFHPSGNATICSTVLNPGTVKLKGLKEREIWGAWPFNIEIGDDNVPRIIEILMDEDVGKLREKGHKGKKLHDDYTSPRIHLARFSLVNHLLETDETAERYSIFEQVQLPMSHILFGESNVADSFEKFKLWETLYILLEGPYGLPRSQNKQKPTPVEKTLRETHLIESYTRFVGQMQDYFSVRKKSSVTTDHMDVFKQVFVGYLFAQNWVVEHNKEDRNVCKYLLNRLLLKGGIEINGTVRATEKFLSVIQQIHQTAFFTISYAQTDGHILLKDEIGRNPAFSHIYSEAQELGIPHHPKPYE